MKAISAAKKVPHANDLPPVFENGSYVLKKRVGVDFRILQLTDLHFGKGLFSISEDKKATAAVIKLVEDCRPDLIVITGDLAYPIPFSSGTVNNMRPSRYAAKLFESFGVPFALVWGNHDYEVFATHKKSALIDMYKSCPHCLYTDGPKDVFGDSNYVVELQSEDGTLISGLVMLDSNMYVTKSFFSGFDNIHDDQVDWYCDRISALDARYNAQKTQRAALAKSVDLTAVPEPIGKADAASTYKVRSVDGVTVPTLAFFHIPFIEYKRAWWALQHGDADAKYNFGSVGEHDQYFGVASRESKLFDKMVQLKSTKGVFVGHDHLNTVSVTYKGVELVYGMSVDYLAYKGIDKKFKQRGGTLISVRDDGSFAVKQLPLDVIDGTADRKIGFLERI